MCLVTSAYKITYRPSGVNVSVARKHHPKTQILWKTQRLQRLFNEHPWKPHYIKGKVGFTEVDIILAHKHRLWVLVRTASSRLALIRSIRLLVLPLQTVGNLVSGRRALVSLYKKLMT